jgi:hypothetical protein
LEVLWVSCIDNELGAFSSLESLTGIRS